MLASVVLIAVFGILTLNSVPGESFQRQVILYIFGIVVFLFAASVDYNFLRNAWQALYWLTLLVLVIVFIFGDQHWLDFGFITVQPSEFAKVVLIASLAVFVAENKERIHEGLEFARSFVEVALPIFALVILNRDLGTALVLLAVWLGVMFLAGANPWHIVAFIVGCMVLSKLLWDHGFFAGYREARILAWLDPRSPEYAATSGLQYLRAWRAIGAGGVWGQGYEKGLLTQSGSVPEQGTDMPFSAVGEEFGFVGGAALVGLYGLLIWRGLNTVEKTQHDLGKYLAAGVVSYLAFEVIVNIGMNVGLLPITGIPLPLFSRGGSNLLATMAALGLLVNVHLRRRRITFHGAT